MVVLQAEDRQFGLVVDGINDTQEIVVKPLGKQLKGLTLYAGATIMGDGRVALILDVLGIGQRSGVLAESREQARAAVAQKKQIRTSSSSGCSCSGRAPLIGWRSHSRWSPGLRNSPQSSIEHAGGRQVVQYRNRILPLVPLREVLEPDTSARKDDVDPVQVIVFNDGDRSLGLIVDQILDVAEEAVTVRQKTKRKGLLGSAVIGKRVADFLDLNQVIQEARDNWFQAADGSSNRYNVLIAEGSAFSRGLIRGGLDMAGYRVLEAGTIDEAVLGLEQQPVDVVVAALDLPNNGTPALLEAMHRRAEWKDIPVLALANSADQAKTRSALNAGAQECLSKFDQQATLESVARLAAAVGVAKGVPVLAGQER